MNEYRILVCGGRDYGRQWNGTEWVVNEHEVHRLYRVLEIAIRNCREGDETRPVVIIHGAARGADSLAASFVEYCRRNPSFGIDNIREDAYPADWDRYRKAAGPIRNQQMLTESQPHVIVAFKGGNGTADMIRIGRKAGVPVYEVKD